ncbi:MAG: hypothetical protein WCB04_09870 [Mycobacteriales bacterium]
MSLSHCPSCRASVRPDALWCPLCQLDLRPVVEPVAAPRVRKARILRAVGDAGAAVSTDVADVPDAADPADADGNGEGRHATPATWPCLTCSAENDLDDSICATCGAAFLAELHTEGGPRVRLPLIGDVSRLGRGAIFGLAVGLGLLGAAMFSLILIVVGALLHR